MSSFTEPRRPGARLSGPPSIGHGETPLTRRIERPFGRLPGGARQAVILAAGAGSRLRTDEYALPKPLTSVAGITLLERAVLVCRDAGVQEILVVTGFERGPVHRAVEALSARHRVTIRAVHNPQWHLGNGSSVLAAEPHVHGAFYLMMCDHIVTPQFLTRLASSDDGETACALAVDFNVEAVPDLPEATKTRLIGDEVARIDKRLERFDAVDTGVFLCRPSMFEALRECAIEGRHRLSDAVQLLADRGQVRSVDCSGLRWLDVDTPEDLERAETILAVEDELGATDDSGIDVGGEATRLDGRGTPASDHDAPAIPGGVE